MANKDFYLRFTDRMNFVYRICTKNRNGSCTKSTIL